MKKIPVINIRGTNGSGKTFLVRKWMQSRSGVPYPRQSNLLGGDTLIAKPLYYKLDDGGSVVGSYESGCGGCDTLDSTEDVRRAIQAALDTKPKYVIFEGVIISTVFESWYNFSKEVGGMHWVYLETPLRVCLKRIQSRNAGADIKEKLVSDKIRAVQSTKRRAEQAGESVNVLNWKRPYTTFSQLMERICA